MQEEHPEGVFLFVIDQSTIQGYVCAEAQFLDASEKSGAMVITSVQEF